MGGRVGVEGVEERRIEGKLSSLSLFLHPSVCLSICLSLPLYVYLSLSLSYTHTLSLYFSLFPLLPSLTSSPYPPSLPLSVSPFVLSIGMLGGTTEKGGASGNLLITQ